MHSSRIAAFDAKIVAVPDEFCDPNAQLAESIDFPYLFTKVLQCLLGHDNGSIIQNLQPTRTLKTGTYP
ncbi:hypothetical protein DSCW_56540 [Desulfosarcina widdelii]|uniref:Uncharacterized protein n=1 Tax=Desulfosarcina widdelii TaxID=947919 RepID=A0A5K7ZP84_9BACT|nr:hypothetical protein DSCW_56540 [Desulfosarcina widdelii]